MFKNMLYMSMAAFFVRFVGAISSFLLARILMPSDYGIWVTLMLIMAYAPIATLGTVEALIKQFPYFNGRKEFQRAVEVEEVVLSSVILLASCLLILGFGIAISFHNHFERSLLPLIFFTILAASINFLSTFYYHRFTAHQLFDMVGKVDALRSVLSISLLLILSKLWGINGTVIGLLITELLVCVLSYLANIKQCGRLSLRWSPNQFWQVVKIGFPITIIWWSFIVQMTIDRIVSSSILGRTMTGYYGFGLTIASAVVLFPQAISRVIYPKVSEKFGEISEPSKVFKYIIIPSQAFGLVLPLVIGLIVLALPYIFINIMPKYREGLTAAQVLLLGSFFVSFVRNGINFLVAVERQRLLMKCVVASLILSAILSLGLVHLGYGIVGLAIASSCSSALFTSLIWVSIFHNTGFDLRASIRELFYLYIPFCISIALLACLICLTPISTIGSVGVFVSNSMIFFVVYFVLLLVFPITRSWSHDLINACRSYIKPNMPPIPAD